MGQMVGKEDKEETFIFTNLNYVTSASITCSFSIREMGKEEAAEAMRGRGMKDALTGMRKSLGAVTAIAESEAVKNVAGAVGMDGALQDVTDVAESEEFKQA